MKIEKIVRMKWMILILFCMAGAHVMSQSSGSSEWIVEFRSDNDRLDFMTRHFTLRSNALSRLSPRSRFHLLRLDPNQLNLLYSPHILRFERSRLIPLRNSFPNDPLLENQQTLEIIKLMEAWDVTTGGVTALGDTIVIAIRDNGFDFEHEDLAGQLWRNRGEIPGDSIDNDQNGYIDDFRGVNTFFDNGVIRRDNNVQHGSFVAGIIGAEGDNGLGISGVNWNVQLMLFTGNGDGIPTAEVIEMMEYILDQKRLYLQTDGREGAFVAAANFSFGINFAFPEDHPIWCAMYDSIGSVGILSAVATTNSFADVDIEGDMPSTCPSDYLLAVTNTNLLDEKVYNSGFGLINIDLAAPGHGSFSTRPGSNYANFQSTSASAPHVTGAAGLLYSFPCMEFAQLLRDRPAEMALVVKDAIMKGTDALPSLEGVTVSGGRLNVMASLRILQDSFCLSDPGLTTLTLHKAFYTPRANRLNLELETGTISDVEILIYDLLGHELVRRNYTPAIVDVHGAVVEMPYLPTGIYLATIRMGKEVDTVKFYVSR